MSDLEESFQKLLSRQPNDSERQRLYQIRDALGLKNNDALWLVLIALQYHQNMYEQHPQAIKQAALEILVHVKDTAESTIAASMAAAKADLAKAIATTASDVARITTAKQAAKWIASCLTLSCLAITGLAWYVHDLAYMAGYDRGYGNAYTIAKDEKAAAAWANTPQGKSAYRLAQAGSIDKLTKCNQPGWKIENRVCYVGPGKDGEIYGWLIP
ncbi:MULTISPECIES: DUF6753 family protein [unclassified Duganella]|uniref:DUF6753 family protein n=1 Tax=unclassified Duganella TaxID=2636909 RepID=UPI000E3519E6|nr:MULTISPECIES: DUF6753 family protein [unclassified Duganella]RFP08278.1 protein mobE [Duganella sp. BJB475]RFP22510.1 protein mobE [Duganella sp. BJB476]